MPDDRLDMKRIIGKVLTYRPVFTLRWLDEQWVGGSARKGYHELQRLIRKHVPVCYMYSAHEPAEKSLTLI